MLLVLSVASWRGIRRLRRWRDDEEPPYGGGRRRLPVGSCSARYPSPALLSSYTS